MPKSRNSNAVDEHVGARVRARRKSLNMNQTVLGSKLGLTFQMIQRYEYGLCRISASTLHAISLALDVPISYFFEGLPAASGRRYEVPPAVSSSLELAKTRHGRTLALLFPRIAHRGSQRAIVELVRAMVKDGPST